MTTSDLHQASKFVKEDFTMSMIRELLDTHEAAITARIKKLREELIPLERELFEIGLAKSGLERTPRVSDQPELFIPNASQNLEPAQFRQIASSNHRQDTFSSPYSRCTIKELVIKALEEHLKDGASAQQLLEFFSKAWGRSDIARTSLSPQLSRLRQEGILVRDSQIWRLRRQHIPETEAAADQ